MASPLANQDGNGTLFVTATATGAINGTVTQSINVMLGRPVVESLPDIVSAFGISMNSFIDVKSQYAQKLTYKGTTLNYGKSFLQQGVNRGAAVILANAP